MRRVVWFAYSPDSRGEHPKEHLHSFLGILQADAFEGEIRGRLRTSAASSYNSFPSLLDSLHQWLQATSPSYPASRRSWRRSAIRWRALLRYSEVDRIEIDSNAAERALRAAALGRKNYLFAGSDSGGERAAMIYSLIGTAKLNRLDPAAHLRCVRGSHRRASINRIADLLPWNLDVDTAPTFAQLLLKPFSTLDAVLAA